MKNDKQKMMILGALAVVMVGVGAFSFMGGSAPAPAPAAKKPEPDAQNTSHAEGEQTPTATATTTETDAGTATANSAETTIRIDPATGKPVVDQGAPANTGIAPPANEINVLVDPEAVRVAQLPQRDPFNGTRWDPMENLRPTTPVVTPTQKPPKTRNSGYRPPRLGGDVGPLRIDPGDLTGPGLNPIGENSGISMPSVEEVPYKVNGIVRGANSAVIVTDGQGKQRIARVGSNLDPDTKVLGVENGKMVVRHRGKIKKVSIDDSGAAQKGSAKPPQNQ
jgi:hypothetical protein